MILGEDLPPLGSECQNRSRSIARIVGSKGGRLAEGAGGLVVHREWQRLARSTDERLVTVGSVGASDRELGGRTRQRVQPDQGGPEYEKELSSQTGCCHMVLQA
jgi:hypothetical protein